MNPPYFPRPQTQNKQKLTHAQLVLPRDRLSSSEEDPCVSANWQLQRWWEESPALRSPSAWACLVPVSSRDVGEIQRPGNLWRRAVLESPALAPYFRGTEGLVTPHDLHAATGDTQLSVQPQEHTHLPTWGCLLILSSGISQRSKTRANPRSTCWGKEGSRTVSHISWVTRALPISFTCSQGRLGFAAGGSVPRLGQNSRIKKSQEEGRGRCDISRLGCECQGKGREMTFTVRDAVNGIDWKTKISTEGSKKAPWSPHGLKIPSCGWGWSGARWKGKNGTLRSNPTHPSLRPFVHIRRARQDVSLACKLQLGNTTLWWGKLVNMRLPIFVVRNGGLTVSITIQW